MMKDNSAADNNVLTKCDKESNFPINFQPIPKRFMVWDTLYEDWRKCKLPGSRHWGYVFELHQLAILLTNASNNGLPRNRFKIVQSTGAFDEDGKEIFEGSIVHVGGETGIVQMVRGDWHAVGDDNIPLSVWKSSGIEILGHILSNPELMEEKAC